jgi:nicotinate dehydrogenase subunit B
MNWQNEPERYELAEPARYSFDLDRRDFFKSLGLGLVVLGVLDAQESGRAGTRGNRPQEVGPWLHVGDNGSVSVFTGKAEMGQNTRTALVQGVAEELRMPVSSIKLIMADTDLVPYDRGTFGSRSMPDMLPQLRKVAAMARKVLDEHGNQPLATVRVVEVPLTAPAEWKAIGQPVPKVDGRAFVTGEHRYSSDRTLPGMLHAVVVRQPAVGATLASVDTSGAEGVTVVRDGEFLAVAAPTIAAARKAASALKPEWKTTEQPSDSELFAILKKTAKPRTESTKGSIEEGLAAADHKLSATYTVAYIAHAPLEPRAALASWEKDKLTVWTGTQVPFGVKSELASAFHIPESQVRVVVPDTGAAYGGKHTGEAAIEAARIAKQAGKPVKLVWTREDEFTHAYFRPAGVIDVQSGVTKDGALTAWEFHNYNSGGSGLATLYDVPHQRVHFHPSESPLRQGSYRGLAATANHFAREVHMDEIAHTLKKDPLEFRLSNMKDPRFRAVLQRAAETYGWGKRPAGIAGGFEKGGYVATIAEVTADKDLKRVKVDRVVTVFECGAIVNPDCLRNQVEGGLIMGLGGALYERIRFENGRILNPQFSKYRVPRFADMPVIESVLIDRKDLPSAGAGETPIVAIAPAISNAIFAATGVRLRSLPMLPA